MKNKLFDVVTLSDRQRGLGDIVSILTGGASVLTQLFPNIFGNPSPKLTQADWLQILPGQGYWTTELRNYLDASPNIVRKDQVNKIPEFTKYFVDERRSSIDSSLPAFPAYIGEQKFNAVLNKFYAILQQEAQTGGQQPFGVTPGGYGSSINLSLLLPIAIGGIILVSAMKKKRGRK